MMMCAGRTLLIPFFILIVERIRNAAAFTTNKGAQKNKVRFIGIGGSAFVGHHSLGNHNQVQVSETISTPAIVVKPPDQLQSLPIGESWTPYDDGPLIITRLCADPDIFLLKNHVPHEQGRNALMDQAERNGWEIAETAWGQRDQRYNSYLSWVQHYIHGDVDIDDVMASFGSYVAQGMTRMSAQFLLQDYEYFAEPVQVVKYIKGGKFNLHHDGLGRAVTCLTYLNGVAGTWFPYAALKEEDRKIVPKPDPDGHPTTEGLFPGQNGLWLVGAEADPYLVSAAKQDHVVKIEPGDAVAFYNYKWIGECEQYDANGKTIQQSSSSQYASSNSNVLTEEDFVECWRTYHVALPTDREKWIATNWFKAEILPDSEK